MKPDKIVAYAEAIMAGAVIIGGILWLSSMYDETKANGQDIHEIKQAQTKYVDNLEEINTRLSRIEGKLGIRTPE